MSLNISSAVPLPEKALIAEIRRMARPSTHACPRGATPTGIGDDCAVLRIRHGHDILVTTDFSLEDIHFRRAWHPPESAGHRCLVRGLSDIAAMGGEPVAAFLSLALPCDTPQSWVRRFARSLIALAKKYRVSLAGGDTAESPNGILADIIVVGSVPKGHAILRSTARLGDRIFVSGELGGSAAAILGMRNKPTRKPNSRDYPRHFYPEPRLEVARILSEKGLVSAMIDISDGLSTDLSHICEESRVGAIIDAALIPLAHVGRPARVVDLDLALHGGEDYELLFTAPLGKSVPSCIAGVPISMIGHITRQPKILLRNSNGSLQKLEPLGWEHFRR
jgi:thiamine-monophosphate kinase